MTTNVIDVILKASTGDLEHGLNESSRLVANLVTGLLALGGITGVAALFDNIRERGIALNSILETSELGIASLVTAMSSMKDEQESTLPIQERYSASLNLASEQMQKLRVSGLQTAATTVELADGFKAATGAGLEAGLSLDQIRQLTIQTTQAIGAMGLPTQQINQEIRALLSGNIDKSATVARNLGISSANVKEWKEAGVLFDKLNERMLGFSVAGKDIASTWEATRSNMTEAADSISAVLTKGFMSEIVLSGQEALSQLFDVSKMDLLSESISGVVTLGEEGFSNLGELIGNSIEIGITAIQDLSQYIIDNAENVELITSAFSDVFDQIGGILVDTTKLSLAIIDWGVQSGTISAIIQTVALSVAAIRDGFIAVEGAAANLIGLFIAGGAELVGSLLSPVIAMVKVFDEDLATSIEGNIENVKQFGDEYAKLGRDKINNLSAGFSESAKVLDEVNGKFSEFDKNINSLREAKKLPGIGKEDSAAISVTIKEIEKLRTEAKNTPQDFEAIKVKMTEVAETSLASVQLIAKPFVEAKEQAKELTKAIIAGGSEHNGAIDMAQKMGFSDKAIQEVESYYKSMLTGMEQIKVSEESQIARKIKPVEVINKEALASRVKLEKDTEAQITTVVEREYLKRAKLAKDLTLESNSKIAQEEEKANAENKKLAVEVLRVEIELSTKIVKAKKDSLDASVKDRDVAAKKIIDLERKLSDEVVRLNGVQIFKSTADKVQEIRRRGMTDVQLETDLTVSASNKIVASQALVKKAREAASLGDGAKARYLIGQAESEAKASEELGTRIKGQAASISAVTNAGKQLVAVSREQLDIEHQIKTAKDKVVSTGEKDVDIEEQKLKDLKKQLDAVKDKAAKPVDVALVVDSSKDKIKLLEEALARLKVNTGKVDNGTGIEGLLNATNTPHNYIDVNAREVARSAGLIKDVTNEATQSISEEITAVSSSSEIAAKRLATLDAGVKSITDQEAPVLSVHLEEDKALETLRIMKDKIDELLAYNGKVISIGVQQKTISGLMEGGRVNAYATGGVTDATGGHQLPGYGGGDRNLIYAEDGEFVVRKERTLAYSGLLHAINYKSQSEIDSVLQRMASNRYKDGGTVAMQLIANRQYATGGLLSRLKVPSLNRKESQDAVKTFVLKINDKEISGLSGTSSALKLLNDALQAIDRSS